MRYKHVLTLAMVVAAAQIAAARATTPVAGLVDRASAYVTSYFHEFSNVVAEERYLQDSHPMPGMDVFGQSTAAQASQHVELRSDVLLVTPAPSSKWLTFRDVYAVNGREVRDRAFRLARLFVDPPPDFEDRVSAIAREGYRYNIGSKDRTIANPMLAGAFLQADYRDRFEYKVDGIDSGRGADVWIVRFKERIRPTILRTVDGRNVSSAGRIWIDGGSGRVLQTELETSAGDKVMAVFAYDERLHFDVPVEMRDIAWFNGMPVTGTATYSNFRRFDVATDETFR
jgi:hypothetical protein